ncbi:hypothetical protein D3C78_1945790 [compost metagenome]
MLHSYPSNPDPASRVVLSSGQIVLFLRTDDFTGGKTFNVIFVMAKHPSLFVTLTYTSVLVVI